MGYKNAEDKKAYQREWAKVSGRNYTAKRKRTDLLRYIIQAWKEANGCVDCGSMFHYAVLQFDHVRGKKLFNIGDNARMGHGIDKLVAEMLKCEVVCANCHAIRTYNRTADVLI